MREIKFTIKAVLLAVAVLIVGCTDDATTLNDPRQLDAPFLRLSTNDAHAKVVSVPVNPYQNTYAAYINYGQPVELTVTVVKAPGKIGSVSISTSVADFGTAVADEASVSNLIGKESGEFKLTFTPNNDLPDEEDRVLNLVINVTDQQIKNDGESAPKTTTITVPVTLFKGCFSEGISSGSYVVTSAEGNLDGGDAFTLDDIVAALESNVVVTITQDYPGVYTVNEITGGVWPLFYPGRANPKLKIDLCETEISGHTGTMTIGGLRTFDVAGSLNDDGTITIQWSYVRVDGNTPASPASGSYTLKRIQ